MPWGFVIEWKEYFIPGAEVLDSVCIPQPVCDVCESGTAEPNPEECTTDIDPSSLDCPYTFDADCMPAWYLQEIVDELTPLCDAILAAFPDICTTTFGDTIPGLIPFGSCCVLDCFQWMLDRKRGACVTIDDVPEDPPGDYPGTADEWARCRDALRHLVLVTWPTFGAALTIAKCLDQDLPPLFGTNDVVVNYKSIQLPAGSYLVNEGCDTITVDEGCVECQPAA